MYECTHISLPFEASDTCTRALETELRTMDERAEQRQNGQARRAPSRRLVFHVLQLLYLYTLLSTKKHDPLYTMSSAGDEARLQNARETIDCTAF